MIYIPEATVLGYDKMQCEQNLPLWSEKWLLFVHLHFSIDCLETSEAYNRLVSSTGLWHNFIFSILLGILSCYIFVWNLCEAIVDSQISRRCELPNIRHSKHYIQKYLKLAQNPLRILNIVSLWGNKCLSANSIEAIFIGFGIQE